MNARNHDLPSGQGRPLVTFAVTGYNQEKYIGEAVDGAFSQTYRPLEIILSDDCSTDRTFAIMQEMAARYTGPHKVVARRNPVNLGTYDHLLCIAAAMSGKLLVKADGDDISKPDRTSATVQLWIDTGAYGLCASYDIVREDGGVLSPGHASSRNDRNTLSDIWSWLDNSDSCPVIFGGTSAFDHRLFIGLPKADRKIYFDDGVLMFALNLMGHGSAVSRRSLIHYRENDASVTNAKVSLISADGVRHNERMKQRRAANFLAAVDYCRRLPAHLEDHGVVLKRRCIDKGFEDTARFCTMQKDWIDASWTRRLALLGHARQAREWKFMLPRLMGLPLFSLVWTALWRVQTARTMKGGA